MAQDLIRIGLFNRDAAIIAADKRGFLKPENIRVEINSVTDSPTLLRSLIRGNYDLILNNADNVIAWAEGQGEDPQKNDFVIFLGGTQGVDQKLVVVPAIKDFLDLKGKLLAADAVTTAPIPTVFNKASPRSTISATLLLISGSCLSKAAPCPMAFRCSMSADSAERTISGVIDVMHLISS